MENVARVIQKFDHEVHTQQKKAENRQRRKNRQLYWELVCPGLTLTPSLKLTFLCATFTDCLYVQSREVKLIFNSRVHTALVDHKWITCLIT